MTGYIEIVIGPDENYALPCGVLMQSILYTNPDIEIRFHIISTNLSDRSKSNFHKITENTKAAIIFYNIDPGRLNGLPPLHGSLATYSILFIANILPYEIKKILYLDADMIVVDSLRELWEVDISGYPAAGAFSIMNDDIRNYNRLDYDCTKGYYNIGTQLINLDYWRKNNILEEALLFIKNNPEKLKYCDQDVLNVILAGKWKTISPRFNFFQNYYMPLEDLLIRKRLHTEIEYARINPCIIHFISNPKPWHKEYNMPLKKIWIFFKNMTPWRSKNLKYYYRGIKLQKYILMRFLTIMGLYRKSSWNADPSLNMTTIIEKIYDQIKERNSKQ
ncbi:MAG: glycosyltransferase family 8 protein [Bacteroidales bacterium]|jgi:lipopolysaccharide biosynthesis glycosyltransferase|nr:glycosyltransferase family 8 protein [Bacteroidales bacterium]